MRPNQIPIFLRPASPVVGGSFPTMVGTSTTATGAGATLTYPAGIAIGDRIYVVSYSGVPAAPTSSAFATYQSGTGTLGSPYAIYTRTADGTEGASTAVTGNAATQYICFVLRGLNATPEESFSISGYTNVPSGTSITTPSATSTKTNCWEIIGVWENQNAANTVNSAPAGSTLIKLFTSSQSVVLYYVPQAAAGASGTNTFSWTSGTNNYGDAFSFMARSA